MENVIIGHLKSIKDQGELLSILKKLYKSFSFIDISQEEFDIIVLEGINKSESYDGSIPYSDYLIGIINQLLINRTCDLLNDSSTSLKLINNYIDNNLVFVDSVDAAIEQFDKLSKFFNVFGFEPDLELLKDLFNNSKKYSSMVEIIMNSYMANIVSGAACDLFDNDILLSSIDVYCDINDISIKKRKIEFDLSKVNSFYAKMLEYPILTRKQERELSLRIAQGDMNARDLFINSNYGLVFEYAHKYKDRGVPFDDLVQEGCIGLVKAVEKFDGTTGFKFSTYGSFWIKQSMTRAIYNDGRNIRLPINEYEKMYAMRKKIDEVERKADCHLSLDELAQKIGCSIKDITNFYILEGGNTVSINERLDSGDELSYFIQSDELTPDKLFMYNHLKELINMVAKKINLTKKQKNILNFAFGLNNAEELSKKKIGDMYRVSRERGRQYVDEILDKFKSSRYTYELAEYMGNPEGAKKYLDDYRAKRYEKNLKKRKKKSNKK